MINPYDSPEAEKARELALVLGDKKKAMLVAIEEYDDANLAFYKALEAIPDASR